LEAAVSGENGGFTVFWPSTMGQRQPLRLVVRQNASRRPCALVSLPTTSYAAMQTEQTPRQTGQLVRSRTELPAQDRQVKTRQRRKTRSESVSSKPIKIDFFNSADGRVSASDCGVGTAGNAVCSCGTVDR